MYNDDRNAIIERPRRQTTSLLAIPCRGDKYFAVRCVAREIAILEGRSRQRRLVTLRISLPRHELE